MENNFLNQWFQGQVKPVRKAYDPPLWEDSILLGADRDSRYYTKARIYVRKPTMEYPSIGIFFNLSNGKGSSFTRFNSIKEVRELRDFLTEAHDKLSVAEEEFIKAETAARAAQEQQQPPITLEQAQMLASILKGGINNDNEL